MIQEQQTVEEPRSIIILKNGIDSNSSLVFKLDNSTTLNNIQARLEKSHICKRQYISQLRLFTEQGVELYNEDLHFLRNGQIVYASFHGEEFDQSSGLAQYTTLSLLGQGGFGKVLLGEHRVTKQKVAIKFVNTASIGNAEDIDMVFREAEMLKSLQHRNIVQIYNCFTLKNMQVVYVMEYLEGGELLEHVQNMGRLPDNQARQYFLQMLDAIQYCHSQKLIHRDLKLENILLADKSGEKLKIVDFGIAGMATNLDVSKIEAGSLKYMAPELFTRKLKNIGPHIDIWALGVILYGMLFGSLPFDGPNQQAIIDAILSQSYELPQNISPELKNLFQKIFDPDYQNRIRISEIQNHPWCTGLTDILKFVRKPLNRNVVTIGAAREFQKLNGASKLSGGPSKLSVHSRLSGGPSKLGFKQQSEKINRVSPSPSENESPLLSQKKSAILRLDTVAQTPTRGDNNPETYRNPTLDTPSIGSLITPMALNNFTPNKSTVQFMEPQISISSRTVNSEITANSPSKSQIKTKRSTSELLSKDYTLVLKRYQNDPHNSTFNLIKLNRETMGVLLPKLEEKKPIQKKFHRIKQIDNMRQSLPNLQKAFTEQKERKTAKSIAHDFLTPLMTRQIDESQYKVKIGFYQRYFPKFQAKSRRARSQDLS